MRAVRRGAAVAVLLVAVGFAGLPAAAAVAAEPVQPTVPPERAEHTAQEVVDSLGFDEPSDREAPPPPTVEGSAFGAIGELLAYLLVGAAVAGLVYVVLVLLRGRGHRRGRDDSDDDDVAVETGSSDAGDDIAALSAAEWRARAAEAEAQGRFADAVRFLHFGGLIGLDEDGLVAFDPGRANGEYVHLVATLAPDSVPADLSHLNRLMEEATFAKRDMDAAALAWSRSGWERVHDGIAAGAAQR
ncbi:MAG: hypothetical protein K1X95_09665 [Acidimicrobiia bacterium]|nr:hypothetical protein [Acidimicrobiia bacterium]